ncbi:MAG TPA: nitroreductase [Candidatus Omnitrophica bacterium]|nr:nitroreductase [Candidatus Omnitrophota bacterium]
MELYNLILKRRTIRKFQSRKVKKDILKKIVNSARLAPSAANLQFLEYLIVDRKGLTQQVFPHLSWAGYLKGRGTPQKGEEPSVYIIVLINKKRSKNPDLRDVGASCENILLASLSFGLGACWLGAINKKALRKILNIPSFYEIDSVIALGYPAQTSRVVDSTRDIKYYLDSQGNLVVPKRPLKEVFHYNSL